MVIEFSRNSAHDLAVAKVAVCFFGIPRSLRYTRDSILTNIIYPIEAFADVKVFVHFFEQETIYNPRSGEGGRAEQFSLIHDDQLQISERPDLCLDQWGFDGLKKYGDSWGDDYVSLRNLIHQLHSLRSVAQLAAPYGADCVVFTRPDLWYYDDLSVPVREALRQSGDLLLLPFWQRYGGQNDRFAIAVGREAVQTYSQRIERAEEFCRLHNRALHSERLLQHSVAGIRVKHLPSRAARIRTGGVVAEESFNRDWIDVLHNRISRSGLPFFARRQMHRAVKITQLIDDTICGRKPVPKSSGGKLAMDYPQLTKVKQKWSN